MRGRSTSGLTWVNVRGVEQGWEILRDMQRVRIGLTGLAFVFVLVLLAAVFSSPDDEAPITPNSLAQQAAPNANAAIAAAEEAEPKEPLAELGVAPGNVEPSNSANGQAGVQLP